MLIYTFSENYDITSSSVTIATLEISSTTNATANPTPNKIGLSIMNDTANNVGYLNATSQIILSSLSSSSVSVALQQSVTGGTRSSGTLTHHLIKLT